MVCIKFGIFAGTMLSSTLTLAETASVFGEMLTFQQLLDQATDKSERVLLANKVEDMINTVVSKLLFTILNVSFMMPEKRKLTIEHKFFVDVGSIQVSVQHLNSWTAMKRFGLHTPFVHSFLCLCLCVWRWFGKCALRNTKKSKGFEDKYFNCPLGDQSITKN